MRFQWCAIEGASLVSLLDGLAKSGWIVRQNAVHDRRSKTVQLTDKAHDTLAHIHATARQLREELLSVLSVQELKQCMQTLQKIKARAKKCS